MKTMIVIVSVLGLILSGATPDSYAAKVSFRATNTPVCLADQRDHSDYRFAQAAFQEAKDFRSAEGLTGNARVLAKFLPGSISLPDGRIELGLAAATEVEGVFARKELANELSSAGVVTIRKLLPEFDPRIVDRYGNTVKTADGEPLYVPHDLRLWFVLELSHSQVDKACADLMRSPDIQIAEPDQIGEPFAVPNDPYFDRQWGLHNTGQYGGLRGKDISALEAWQNFGTGIYPVRIGVLDSGIDFDHPDFHQIEQGVNFAYLGPPADDDSGRWHGSAVAGIIGMKGNNSIGGTGVGWHLTIVPIKVAKWGWGYFESYTVAGLDWARSQGIKVVNMSYGWPSYSTALLEALQNNRVAGMINVASAGNFNTSEPRYPAGCSHHCISVNAFLMNGDRWEDSLLCGLETSDFGSNFGSSLDLTAPGGRGIFTTKHSVFDDGYYEVTEPWRSCSNGGIADWDLIDGFGGTSAAAAFVSGCAGLILAMNPNLDGEDAEHILILTARDVKEYGIGWDEYSGWGRPNLAAALELVCPPYVAERVTGVAGGTATYDGSGNALFYNLDGLPNGMYYFKRYRVDKTIPLSEPFIAQPFAWGRVQGSVGWRRINSGDNFNILWEDAGWTEVVSVSRSNITVRNYYYKLYNVNGQHLGTFPNNGNVRYSFTVVGPVDYPSGIGVALEEKSNHLLVTPNPATGWVRIYLGLQKSEVLPRHRVSIYDVTGRLVRTLVSEGKRSLLWDLTDGTGQSIAAGVYFLKLENEIGEIDVERLIVVR